MIIIFNELEKVTTDLLKQYITILPIPIQNKANSILNEERKKQFVIGYLLVVYCVYKNTNKLSLPLYSYDHNKPFIKDFNFNISHSNNIVCLVTNKEKIGIDIEEIKAHSNTLKSRVLNEEELKIVQEAKYPDEEFIKFWTKKESYLKCIGQSKNVNWKNILSNNNYKFKTIKYNNYIITICNK